MTSTFDRAMQMMRKHNRQTQEDGFETLKQVAAHHVQELISAFEVETDHGLKCWLLELIGLARSDEALPLLASELTNQDESLRDWAEQGLRALDTTGARTVLWEHGIHS